MTEVSLATIGALAALLLAAAVGITSRNGVRLVLIAIVLSLIPEVSQAVSEFAANEGTRE